MRREKQAAVEREYLGNAERKRAARLRCDLEVRYEVTGTAQKLLLKPTLSPWDLLL